MLTLRLLDGEYVIHRLPPEAPLPGELLTAPFFSATRTAEELSVVCRSSVVVAGARSEPGWSCLKVEGPLDFSLTGILAGLTDVLARAGVSVFALSTFDTDYLLVRAASLAVAGEALRAAGYRVNGVDAP